MTCCAIWCHLNNSKNVKNTHGRVLLLLNLQAKAWWKRQVTPKLKIFQFYVTFHLCNNFLEVFDHRLRVNKAVENIYTELVLKFNPLRPCYKYIRFLEILHILKTIKYFHLTLLVKKRWNQKNIYYVNELCV